MHMKYLKFILGTVLLFSGIFSVRAQQLPQLPNAPAGVANSNYQWIGWFTPDTYLNNPIPNTGWIWANGLLKITSPIDSLVGHFLQQGHQALASTVAPPQVPGYNFHRALQFSTRNASAAPNQMGSTGQFRISNDEAFTIFFVAKKGTSPNGSTSSDFLLGYGPYLAGGNTAGVWWSSASTNMTMGWPSTARSLGNVESGIIAIDNPNSTSSMIKAYSNGKSSQSVSNAVASVSDITLRLASAQSGSSGPNLNGSLGFNGDMQEIIIVKRNKATMPYMDPVDLQKIQSYLAIKYGITLSSGDYLNSAGGIVWSRNGNNGFNNHIFGLGLDATSALNQIQSRSASSDKITLYKGTLSEYNNNLNISPWLMSGGDKTFLMLGSNGQTGTVDSYSHLENTNFFNSKNANPIGYRDAAIYKAQITTSGLPGIPQTVNVKVNMSVAKYVLVSANQDFLPAQTRIYPITDQIATGVVINNNDFVSIACYQDQITPGGAINTNFIAWLTPENYANGVWKNSITTAEGIGNFSGSALPSGFVAPAKKSVGYNYHEEVSFDKTGNTQAPNALLSERVHGISGTTSIGSIFVLKRRTIDNTDYLIGYGGTGEYLAINWRTNNTNTLTHSFPTNGTSSITIGEVKEGIFITDNPNIAGMSPDGLRVYKDGVRSNYQSWNWNGTDNIGTGRVVLGGRINNSRGYGYQGELQEVILIKNPNNGHINPIDLRRIHSYLAIKYGIKMDDGESYIISDGTTVVWTRDNNYNTSIFGIGRDDASGLYQKQAKSSSDNTLEIFAGNTLTTLNSQNTTTLKNKHFLMLGKNNSTGTEDYVQTPTTDFGEGSISDKINFRSSGIYKTQVTDEGVPSSMTVGIKVNTPYAAKYLLVSTSESFIPINTRVYELVNGTATNVPINNGEFIAFCGYMPTPGGISFAGSNNYTLDLWVDGDHSTASSWPNLMPGDYALGKVSTAPTPAVQNSNYNFHKELYFGNATNSKLGTTPNNFGIAAGQAYYMFVVSEQKNTSTSYLLNFQNNFPETNYALGWSNSTTGILRAFWPGTERNPAFAAATHPRYGIATMNIANIAGAGTLGRIRMYLNGVSNATQYTFTGAATSSNYPLVVGNANFGADNTNGLNGSIQEIIMIRKKSATSSADTMSQANLNKIHSYLAIKYGLKLYGGTGNTKSNVNYVNSDGNTVWNIATNNIYNNNIFGIGRDDASGLYQKQSKSVEDKTLTIYKGNTLATLNSDNNGTLDDKLYIMLGSNNTPGYVNYPYESGDLFSGVPITDKTNYRVNLAWLVQVTEAGIPSAAAQTVSFKLNTSYLGVKYLLVSPDGLFSSGNTSIYPVDGGVASDVSVSDGNYISFCGYMATPGGISLSGYALDLWVDGNHSTNTSWDNLIPTANFQLTGPASYSPVVKVSNFNYHNELYFGNKTGSKLGTTANYTVATGNSYHVFIVSDARNSSGSSTLITHNNSSTSSSMRWNSATSADGMLQANWPGDNRRPYSFAAEGYTRYGITSIDLINNNTTNSFNLYQNGSRYYITGATSNASNPLRIGNASNSATNGSAEQLRGSIQEVIVMRKTVSPGMMTNTKDIAQIHSYLAIKYGITLNDTAFTTRSTSIHAPNPMGIGANYLNSKGDTVWHKTANAGFNNQIFGIARDDESGLYQKQAKSADNPFFSIYLGNSIYTLNSDNPSTLDDMQYLLVGSDGGSILKSLDPIIPDSTEYSNGYAVATEGFNIQSCVYKSQITGPLSAMEVNMLAASNDYLYVLVSPDTLFTPSETMRYPIARRIAADVTLDQTYKYFKFIGFNPGPGGINPGLRLWLRADDETALGIEYLPKTENKLLYYPYIVADEENIPAVSEWKDQMRGQTYSYAAGGVSANHRIPVYEPSNPEMNFHPAVRFWGSGNSYGSYLSNNATNVMPWSRPDNGKHTAYFVVNNNFGTNPWVYSLTFGSAATTVIPRPGYGVQKISSGTYSGNTTGRFRTASDQVRGKGDNLFDAGATSLMGFYTQSVVSGTNNLAYFRFNGVDGNSYGASGTDTDSEFDWDDINFQTPSMLGTGYEYNRTILGVMSEAVLFDRSLTNVEVDKIESYFSFKYGVTLRPSRTTTKRFNYIFSDTTMVWKGDSANGKFVDFYNNIAAVIRDDVARLENIQTHSTDVGSILHMAVAGTELGGKDDSKLGRFEYDREAVVFGDNNVPGETPIVNEDGCGDFDFRFDRKWLVHKVTRGGRPVEMLVGVENNSGLTIGNDPSITDYYTKFNAGHNISMIVGTSPENIEAGIYTAVVPMTYINGEHQCKYIFQEEDTYITFGYKPNSRGCVGDEDAVFTGTKKFEWTSQWTTRTNSQATTIAGRIITVNTPVDLGDSIKVLETKVTYPSGVRAQRYYPRPSSNPARGSLEVRRRGGSTAHDVEVSIKFNHPVIPEFSISGIDGANRSYEEIDITGVCSGSTFVPEINYAATPNRNTTYKIAGNRITAVRNSSIAANNKNGMANVTFKGGVTEIIIKYRLSERVYGTRSIYISPITLRTVPPPPPINEDGLSFVKQINEREMTTCEDAIYSFFIQNVNCEAKYVTLTDTLPNSDISWKAESLVLDSVNAINTSLRAEGFAGEQILRIDSLLVPGTSTIQIKVSAVFDALAPSGEYSNRATIGYDRIEGPPSNPDTIPQTLQSLDRETLKEYTTFYAEWQQRQGLVNVDVVCNKSSYIAEGEANVVYTITNPNSEITDVFFDVNFNEEFTCLGVQVDGDVGSVSPVVVVPDDLEPGVVRIAGNTDGEDGFALPEGTIVITVRLKAPIEANLQDAYDDEGYLTGEKVDLVVTHTAYTTMDDPCVVTSMNDTSGEIKVPYRKSPTHVITNKNVTTKIKKK